MRAMGLDVNDPRVVGASYFAVKWREAGYSPDVVVNTIERVMAKRTEAPGSLKYFEQAIADAHAELARGVPQGTTGPPGRRKRESFFDLAIELENRSHERAADSTTPAVALIEANAGDRVSDG
jgi:Uma2 family endonuclease